MQTVNVPGVGSVGFPDGMSQQEMADAIDNDDRLSGAAVAETLRSDRTFEPTEKQFRQYRIYLREHPALVTQLEDGGAFLRAGSDAEQYATLLRMRAKAGSKVSSVTTTPPANAANGYTSVDSPLYPTTASGLAASQLGGFMLLFVVLIAVAVIVAIVAAVRAAFRSEVATKQLLPCVADSAATSSTSQARTNDDEDIFYAQAGDELRTGKPHDAVWARALAETNGSKAATKARFVQLREQDFGKPHKTMQQAETQRGPFWKLWLKCTAVIFVVIVALGGFAGGAAGLAYAIGGGLVLAPLKGLLVAGIIRLFTPKTNVAAPEAMPAIPIVTKQLVPVPTVSESTTQATVNPSSTQVGDNEEAFYAQVGAELRTGKLDDATWARALAQADGAEAQVKSVYVKLRVESLRKSPNAKTEPLAPEVRVLAEPSEEEKYGPKG